MKSKTIQTVVSCESNPPQSVSTSRLFAPLIDKTPSAVVVGVFVVFYCAKL